VPPWGEGNILFYIYFYFVCFNLLFLPICKILLGKGEKRGGKEKHSEINKFSERQKSLSASRKIHPKKIRKKRKAKKLGGE